MRLYLKRLARMLVSIITCSPLHGLRHAACVGALSALGCLAMFAQQDMGGLTVGDGRVDLSHGAGIAADKFHDYRLDNAIAWFRERLATQTGAMMQPGAPDSRYSVW